FQHLMVALKKKLLFALGQILEEQYPLQENGQILLAFPRLFIVARRME
ncbi:trans-aconitate 2-methyltransferase, partial [Escherichia sp. SS-MK2]